MLVLYYIEKKYFFYCYSYDSNEDQVQIVLVGKYTKLEDAYTSVIKALKHAALACRRKLKLVV